MHTRRGIFTVTLLALACGQVESSRPCMLSTDCAADESCVAGACVTPDADVPSGGGGGSGTAGGASGAGGGVSGGGGNAAVEDCTDGLDNDGNGLVDCADPSCFQEYSCVPPTPADWNGPVAMFFGAEPAPGCAASAGFPVLEQDASAEIAASPAICPTCICTLTTSSCSADLTFFSDSACSAACWGCTDPITITAGVPCGPLPPLCHEGGKVPGAVKVNVKGSGSCKAATTGTPVLPDPTWAKSVRACGQPLSTGLGCGVGACLPKPQPPFDQKLCVYRSGDVACEAPFGFKRVA